LAVILRCKGEKELGSILGRVGSHHEWEEER
jgi:hypothetical protein